MPIISGGGGGPAAGSYIPVANKAGVTVDTTTYADVLKGGGAKLTTLVFPAGAQGAIAFALSGDAFPRLVWSSDVSGSGLFIGDGTGEPTANNANLTLDPTSAQQGLFTPGTLRGSTLAATQVQFPLLKQVSPLHSITSGALPTQQLVSGTGAQLAAPGDLRDVETVTPCTFNPGAATTATVTVALSSDNVTYSTLAVVTEPAGVALDGTILPVKVRVPAGWYLKLTANAQAVLGLTTYY